MVLQAVRQEEENWINSSVTYQIYPLSFNYGKGSASDPHQGAYGNLKGITEKVDYIASLGVDAVWLCPFFASPLQTGFGYNVTDYCDVGETFGTLEDFDEMVKAFHAKGLKVITDQVYSHTSDQHPWFQASRDPNHPEHETYKDFYVWYPKELQQYTPEGEPVPPNNWRSIMSRVDSAWEWDAARGQFYLHSFDQVMPDLNINHPAVQDAVLNNARFWLDRGIDGFRLDAVCHYGHDKQFRDNPLVDLEAPFDAATNPQRKLFDVNQPAGWDMLERLRALMQSYDLRWMGHGRSHKPGMLGEFNFDKGEDGNKAGEALVSSGQCDTFYTAALREGPGQGRGLLSFRQDVEEMLRLSPDGSRINWAASNHDMARWRTRWFGPSATDEHAKLGMSLLLSLPGSICIYQGEELGLDNPELETVKRSGDNLKQHDPLELSRDACFPWDAARTPMPWNGNEDAMWLMSPASHKDITVEAQLNDSQSMLAHTRQMIAKRQTTPALRDPGSLEFIETESPEIVAFVRKSARTGQQVLCAFNFTDKAVEITLPKGMLAGKPGTMTAKGERQVLALAPLTPQFTEVMTPRQGVDYGDIRQAAAGR